MRVSYLFSYLIQDSTLYLAALSSFSCMQQILVNSLFIFILCKYFLVFLVMASQKHLSFKSGHLISKCMDFKNIFYINFSFKCFLLCNNSVFFSLLILRLSVAKSKNSFGKCHIPLEKIWIIFKYLLTLISNIISQ